MTTRLRLLRWAAPLLLVVLGGCQIKLMPTPNIYVDNRYELYEPDLPASLRTNTVDLLYLTDRKPETKKDGSVKYGWGRSRSAAFGSVVVEFGNDVDWATLVENSTRRKRTVSLPVKIRSTTELGRFPEIPPPIIKRGGRLMVDPEVRAEGKATLQRFQDEVRRRLELSPVKEVVVYVHGFNNTFDYAAGVLAQMYHWGRTNLPILYSWPAGSPGALQGYTHDTESGCFTIFHLKQFIRGLAAIPEVERINIFAHSRGTDVAATALRELLIEERGGGRQAKETYRIGHVILASPDLDFDLITQRFAAEQLFRIMDEATVYVSEKDKALGLAEWLLRSDTRLGKIRPEDISEADREFIGRVDRVSIIDARVKTGSLGHGYYHSSPAVSSDLIMVLRYGFKAGSPERPLKPVFPGYWVLDDEKYPFVEPDDRDSPRMVRIPDRSSPRP